VALAASVIAVDDRPAFLDVVRKIVQATPGLVMVGEATCGEQAVELVEQMRPDLVVMDVRMPGIGGVGATRKIKAAHPSTIVALISTCSPEELLAETEGSSADAVICKRDLRPAVLQELWQRHRASAN
jgi:two-component system, NarL family, invasion response regulator UvrY